MATKIEFLMLDIVFFAIGIFILISPKTYVGFQKSMLELFQGGTYTPDSMTVLMARLKGIVIICLAVAMLVVLTMIKWS